MTILAIETSCDETAAAVVCGPRDVRSNVVYSQVALHGPYGGVVPEIACRCHVEVLPDVIVRALAEAGVGWGDIDEVAVTYGPGLASSLLVGLSAAKGLALRLNRPLCAVNHLQAHIHSAFMSDNAPEQGDVCPFLSLVVSGGHTCVIRVDRPGAYRMLGRTIDDAAGEAFDKGAKLLGLGYPGGPVMDRTAKGGRRDAISFPRGRVRQDRMVEDGLQTDLCFSFSGLKTSLLHHLQRHPLAAGDAAALADVVASYQEAIVESLVSRTRKALRGLRALAVGGGVSLNSRLREALQQMAAEEGVRLLLSPPKYCGDNAAMIGAVAAAGGGVRGAAALAVDAEPNLDAAAAS